MSDAHRDIEMQVVHRDGKVTMLFSRRVNGELKPAFTDNLLLSPAAAITAAEMLSTMAFEADTSLKPVGETLKASLVEKHRERLLPLVANMLRSMVDQRFAPERMAREVVDACFSEVFS